MNMMAAAVVALLKKVEAPVLPNRVWLEPPPNAAPMSAPLPVWSRTIIISAMQTMMWMIISSIDMLNFFQKFELGMRNAEVGIRFLHP